MKTWYRVAFFNLLVLALLGLALRYKINFPMPYFQQENLLHAHSHFAFNGWIGFLLQVVILEAFTNDYKKWWDKFFLLSTIVNYAMIISFAWTGYSAISIILSTGALFLSYIFAWKIYKAVDDKSKISVRFVLTALFFLVLSSLGPYALAIIMANHSPHQYWYHNALYFFLHFQYNGWFTFAVLGLLMQRLERQAGFNFKNAGIFYYLLAITCIPSWFFTSLWYHRPEFITHIVLVTAVLQTFSLYFLLRLLRGLPPLCKLAMAAFVLKMLLQSFAVHPDIAQLAFGFRPIIIGYLHLIFLAFISMYLLGYMSEIIAISRSGLIIFATGIIINEILLAVQGFASIYYLYLPAINILLFYNTLVLVIGALFIYISILKKNGNIKRYLA